jgi:hypothetical protein
MSDNKTLLEAHVAFEMARLTGQGAVETVASEVDALFGWLADVTLLELAAPADVAAVVVSASRRLDAAQGLTLLEDVLDGVLNGLAETPDTVGDVVGTDDVQRWAVALAGMEKARSALLASVTSSSMYTRLVAHVVYHGLKSYVLTENVLAKRIPGASSLVRLGQRSLGAAAPGLEQNIDRQLIAFVDANIADTVRESQRFLDGMLDADLVAEVSVTAWSPFASRPLAALPDAVDRAELTRLLEATWQQWDQLRDTPAYERLVGDAVEAFFASHGERPVADLLADLGITPNEARNWAVALAVPMLEHAVATGYLEQRVRARLAAFYDSYGSAAAKPRRRSTRPTKAGSPPPAASPMD